MAPWVDHVMRDAMCPACGHGLNRAADPYGGRAPLAGDLTVCIRCAAVLEFNVSGGLTLVSDAMLAALARDDPKLAQKTARIQAVVRRLPPEPDATIPRKRIN